MLFKYTAPDVQMTPSTDREPHHFKNSKLAQNLPKTMQEDISQQLWQEILASIDILDRTRELHDIKHARNNEVEALLDRVSVPLNPAQKEVFCQFAQAYVLMRWNVERLVQDGPKRTNENAIAHLHQIVKEALAQKVLDGQDHPDLTAQDKDQIIRHIWQTAERERPLAPGTSVFVSLPEVESILASLRITGPICTAHLQDQGFWRALYDRTMKQTFPSAVGLQYVMQDLMIGLDRLVQVFRAIQQAHSATFLEEVQASVQRIQVEKDAFIQGVRAQQAYHRSR